MEKTLIDKIAGGEISTLELVERLKGFSQETIEDFIILMEIEGVDCKIIAMVRRELNVPDPLLEEVKQAQETWQKVKSENGLELYSIDENGERVELTDEQVLKAVALYQAALQKDQAAQEPEQAAPQLPPELDNDKAKGLLQMAIDRNIIDKSYRPANGSTHETIAYLSATLSRLLKLNKTKMRNGQNRVLWKPFKSLFGIKYLAQTYSRIIDNEDGTLIKFPPNYKKIDEIYYMVMTGK